MSTSVNSAKWFLLAALLLAGMACAAGNSDIPESYNRFWEGPNTGLFPCITNLPLLNLEKTDVMDAPAIARLELPAGFSAVREKMQNASEKIKAAKEGSVRFLGISFLIFEVGEKVRLYADGNPYPMLASTTFCGMSEESADIWIITEPAMYWKCHELWQANEQACKAMGDSLDALQAAAYASNDARDAAASHLETLGRMGADYGNYSGSARGVYSDSKEALEADPIIAFNGSREITLRYDDQAPRFAAAYVSAYDVKTAFENGSAQFERPDSYAAAIDLMAGRDENLVTGWAAVYWNIDSAISGMESEWNGSERAADAEYSDADSAVAALEEDGYSKITADLISNFSEAATGPIHGSFNAAPPDERVANARAMLQGANANITEARRLSNAEYEEDYLARAIETSQRAHSSITSAKSMAEEAKAEVEEIISAADGLYGLKSSEVRSAIDSFSTETPGSARLKANAETDYREAVGLAATARAGTSGKHLAGLAAALGKLESAKLWLSDENVSIAIRRDAARDELARLNATLNKAEHDGIGVTSERDWLNNAMQGRDSGTAEDMENFKEKAELAEEEVYAKAAAQFGYLDWQVSALDSTISAIRSYRSILGSAAELEAKFREFDELKRNYASGGTLVPEKALGHYLEIADKLDAISQEVESNKAKMIQEMMEKSARYDVAWEGEPILDEEMSALVSVRLANELPFGTNSSLSVSIPGDFPSGLSVVSKDAAIFSVDATGTKITAYFTSVSAGSAYSISLKGSGAEPARSVGRQQGNITSLHEQELVGSETLEFEALRDLDRLAIPMEIPEGTGRLSAEMENGRVAEVVNSDGMALVSAERVRKGRGSVTLAYHIPNPYLVTEGDAEVRKIDNLTARITYNVTVSSRAMDLSDVPVLIFVQNVSGEEGVSVRGLDGASLRNFEQQPSQGGVSVSWSIRSLGKGESATYEVSYAISDPGEYAEWFYSQDALLINSLDEAGLIPEARLDALKGKLADARGLLDSQKCMEAIAELKGLSADAQKAAKDSQIQETARAGYYDELAQFKKEKAALGNLHDGLFSAGLDSEARKVQTALDAAGESEDEAAGLADDLNFGSAKAKISDARKSLHVDLSGPLNNRVESLSKEADLLNKRGHALSLLDNEANLSDFQVELAGIRSSISDADYSSAATGIAGLNRSLSAKEGETDAGFGRLVPEFEGYAREVSELKIVFGANLVEFSKSSKNETILGQARNDLAELGRLDSLLSNFSSSPEKPKFLEANAEKLAGISAEIATLNGTSASLAQATQAYAKLANSSFSEASLKLEQARKIVPASGQYADRLQNLTSILSDAESALTANNYADAAVLSEKVRAGAELLLSAASQVEQKEAGAGFSFQPVYLLLPLLFFLALGYVFLKKRPEKPQEAKPIQRLEF